MDNFCANRMQIKTNGFCFAEVLPKITDLRSGDVINNAVGSQCIVSLFYIRQQLVIQILHVVDEAGVVEFVADEYQAVF